jgi:hypothetical protein
MAKLWKEELDWLRHQNKMDAPVDHLPNVSFVPEWVFFVLNITHRIFTLTHASGGRNFLYTVEIGKKRNVGMSGC